MKARSLLFSVVTALLAVTQVAQAQDQAVADSLFQQRANNPAKIEAARAEYLKILNAPATPAAQKVAVATQLGRLWLYQGEMLTPKTDRVTRQKLFQDCWQTMEKINVATVGKTPAYFYFKGVCLAYWGEVVSTTQALLHITELLNLIKEGKALDQNFEGGAINRLAAGVHSNPGAKPFPASFHLYDIPAAKLEIDAAIAATGGAKFYENLRGKGMVLAEAGEIDAAKAWYAEQIETVENDIASGDAPAERAAENAWSLEIMKSDLAALQ